MRLLLNLIWLVFGGLVMAFGSYDRSRKRNVTNTAIEILYFHGCPSHEKLLPIVERLADQTGAALRLRCVETPEAAETERFLGSPTVRVNGVDVDPTASERADFGLKCRIYRSDEGQSPLPPERWIHEALKRSSAPSTSS
jgi:hypothetical protein